MVIDRRGQRLGGDRCTGEGSATAWAWRTVWSAMCASRPVTAFDGTTPARVKGITAARPDIRLLFDALGVGGLNGAGPGDRDEALGLCRCGSRGFEQAGEAVLGLRGRFLMHGDRW
ncbi:hypothetical protein ABT215_06465 [Streptomyces sp900105755]|uniref:hypothetical protein n=1 Tax=Streptomyces sp. 900105755 TaxID=3154389 RepID=UPI00331C1CB3